jgi:sarcosine oxidase subunit beta
MMGAAAALHLRERGLDVVLVERDDIAQGTSTAGAGFIDLWGAGYVPSWDGEELEIEHYGLDFYASLAERGHDLAYRRNGTLSWRRTAAYARPIAEMHNLAHRLRGARGSAECPGAGGDVVSRTHRRVTASAAVRR